MTTIAAKMRAEDAREVESAYVSSLASGMRYQGYVTKPKRWVSLTIPCYLWVPRYAREEQDG
jgi:hypothetical protein